MTPTGALGTSCSSDRAAIVGRELAVYRKGYPDHFPFAADFWYTFPGYLPDGRMAMAAEDHTTSLPTLCVLTFDANGEQTDDLIRVELPEELHVVPKDDWFYHKDRMKRQLIDTIGFRPGFIRIKGCRFPGDNGYNEPSWDINCEIGAVDGIDSDAPDDPEEPCGFGGRVASLLRRHGWVFGWDRYGDKEGEIHST